MSGHGFGSTTDKADKDRAESGSNRLPTHPPSHIIPHPVQSHPDLLKTLQASVKSSLANRPIAPAPSPISAGVVRIPAPVTLAGAVATQLSHNLVTKVPTGNFHGITIKQGIMGNTLDASHTSQSALNIQSVPPQPGGAMMQSAVSVGQAAAPVVTQGAPPPGSPTVVHAQPPTLAGQVSLINRGAPMPGSVFQPPLTTPSSQAGIQPITLTQPMAHTFPSHVPRGITVASALNPPKAGSAMATAVLRPSQPATVHLPTTTPSPVLPSLHHQIRTPVIPLRPAAAGTPPVTRAGSPAVSVPSGPPQADIHRPVLSQHVPTTATTTTVQITIQQPRSTADVPVSRPILSQVPTSIKPVHMQQPLVQGAMPIQPTQKVVMSQATVAPIVQPATIAAAPGPKPVPLSVSIQSTPHPPVAPGVSVPSTLSTTTTVTAAPSIPIAKVPPQRQRPHSPQSIHDVPRESLATAPGSIFVPQTHRGSPSINTPVTSVTMATETRPQDRPALSHIPYAPHMPDYLYVNYNAALMYQQVAQAQGFTTTPISSATALRPSCVRPSLVPNQPASLTATLQAASHVAVTSAPGVRINPMMVTVDPNRHPHIPMHTQFTSAAEVPPTVLPFKVATTSSSTEGATTSTHATSVFTTAISTQAPSSQPPTQPPTSLVNNPSASPRPSILRKRPTNEGTMVAKKNLTSVIGEISNTSSPVAESTPPSTAVSSPKPSIPCDPSRENSQSSTDTATSTETTPPPVTQPVELKIKQEPMDTTESVTPRDTAVAMVMPLVTVSSNASSTMEASPRKKPRKQLLNANEELKDGTSTDEEVEKLSSKSDIKQIQKAAAATSMGDEDAEFTDEEGVRWVACRKRPNISLMNHYHCTWKPKNNHFLRYSDIKAKDERRPTVNELSNQKGVVQKASGWKLFHLAAQLEEMMDLEKDVFKKMTQIQNEIAPKSVAKNTMEDDIGMVHELTQGNIQRCQLVMDQLDEAKDSMIKILDHKNRILEIITKHHSKRPVKKKERT